MLFSVGVLLIVLGVVAAFVVPALAVKYPGGPLNKTAHATGTFTLYIDPATAGPLATPQKLPLDIKRNLHVIETSPAAVPSSRRTTSSRSATSNRRTSSSATSLTARR